MFGGLVIKYVGDGDILGSPEPGLCIADMAPDAATCVAGLGHLALIAKLSAVGCHRWPYGSARTPTTVSSPPSDRPKDGGM